MRKLILITICLVLLLGSQHCNAVSKFESMLLHNPRMFRLIAIAVAVLVLVIIFGYNYISTKKATAELRELKGLDKKRRKEVQREIALRNKEYKKMPKGPIDHVSLPPAILVSLSSEKEKEYEVAPIRELTIGRSLENLVIVDRPSTSRNHAKIRPQREGYVIYDLTSMAGTYVNSERIMKHVLRDGEIISIGKEDFLFKF